MLTERDSTTRRSDGWSPTPTQAAVLGFLAVSAVLLLIGRYASLHMVNPGRQSFEPGGTWFGPWVRYDANWYFQIARNGYDFRAGEQRAIAFWPSYPMSIRALSLLTNDEFDAGMLITWISGSTTVVLLARWCQDRMTRMASIAAVVSLLLFPYAWYLHWAVYGDALFAASAIGAFLLLERGRPVLAGLLGAFAAAGRPMGMAVCAGLLVLTLERRDVLVAITPRNEDGGATDPWWRRILVWLRVPTRLRRGELRWSDTGVLLSLLGPILYMAFLWHSEGTPLAFAGTQSAPGWDHEPGPATWFKISVLNNLRTVGFTQEVTGMVIHGLITVGAILLIPKIVRRFGWGYGLFCVILVGIPAVSSKDFYGLGRYLLAAFPIVAVAGEWLVSKPVWLRSVAWSLSAVLAGYLAYSYARGLYVA